VGETRNAYKILVEKPEGRPLRRSEGKREDSIKTKNGGEGGTSIGTEMGYELDGQEIGTRFPTEARDFSFLYSSQTSFGVHPASYRMGTEGFLKG
jgi:hypothetical protein